VKKEHPGFVPTYKLTLHEEVSRAWVAIVIGVAVLALVLTSAGIYLKKVRAKGKVMVAEIEVPSQRLDTERPLKTLTK